MKRLLPLLILAVLLISWGAVEASADSGVRYSTDYNFADAFEDILSTNIHLPSTNIVSSVQSNYSTEFGERVHDCRFSGPAVGSHSVWFMFNFPGGTVTIDTGLSSYDTLMSIYRPAGKFTDLETVACNDDQVAGSNSRAKIVTALAAGTYFVQISYFSTTPTASSLSLTVVMTGAFSGTAPANDNFASARTVILGKTMTISNVQFATEEILEPDLGCLPFSTPSRSVWFKFDNGAGSARLNITLEGSVMNAGSIVNADTSVEVFSGPSLLNLNSLACNNDAENDVATLHDVAKPFGQPVYIRVTEATQHGLSGPSTYKVKVTASYLSLPLVNADFENPLGLEWKENNLSGADGRLCGFGAFLGDCIYQFTGSANESSSLKQQLVLPVSFKPAKSGQIFAVFALHALSPSTNFKATLLVKYTDATLPTKAISKTIGSPGPDWALYGVTAQLSSKNVGSVTLQFVNKSSAGVLWLDSSGTAYRSGFTRTTPEGLLPLPAAADLQ
jgi:hypothetical protein